MGLARPDAVFHFAAESHVCRSIAGPDDFVTTNINGTFNLLEAWREYLQERFAWSTAEENLRSLHRFVHVSTDEVFGDLGLASDPKSKFHEQKLYAPTSPYAASKAASDHLVKAWAHTYGLNAVVTNCTNNYGPNQHEEKLIPSAILKILNQEVVKIYGKGDHVRDWIWVEDHCRALDTVFRKGKSGESYGIGGDNERTVQDVVTDVYVNLVHMGEEDDSFRGLCLKTINTNDRPTDDERYAMDTSKIRSLGWSPTKDYHSKLRETIAWYIERWRARFI